MEKQANKSRKYIDTIYRCINPIIDPLKIIKGMGNYIDFLSNYSKYTKMEGAEDIKIINLYPCLYDRTKSAGFDAHYFYQDIWAFKKIYESKVPNHVDVGSKIDFVGFLTAITNVTFIDIRPLEAALDNFNSRKGTILSLPFDNESVLSLSCLHVAEHIGLGRYGDSLDPLGTKKAAKELSRVIASGGNIYFSLPVGKPRLCFNAHRIHSTQQIIDYFNNLELRELSCIGDDGVFRENVTIDSLENADYACGLFWFRKS